MQIDIYFAYATSELFSFMLRENILDKKAKVPIHIIRNGDGCYVKMQAKIYHKKAELPNVSSYI